MASPEDILVFQWPQRIVHIVYSIRMCHTNQLHLSIYLTISTVIWCRLKDPQYTSSQWQNAGSPVTRVSSSWKHRMSGLVVAHCTAEDEVFLLLDNVYGREIMAGHRQFHCRRLVADKSGSNVLASCLKFTLSDCMCWLMLSNCKWGLPYMMLNQVESIFSLVFYLV